jgi:hypothetical protein
VQALRELKITPYTAIGGHPSETGKQRKTAIDRRTLRHPAMASVNVVASGSRRCSTG